MELQDSQEPTPSSSSTPSTGAAHAKDTEKKDNKKRKHQLNPNGSFVIAPMPIVSPAIGAGLVPVVGYITPIPASDRTTTPSVFGVSGLITNNGSRSWGLGTDLYLDKSRYRVNSVYAKGNLDYNLYGIGFASGNAGRTLPLSQTGHIFFFKTLRSIRWDFYAGVRFIAGSSFITVKPMSGETPPIPPDVGLKTNLRC